MDFSGKQPTTIIRAVERLQEVSVQVGMTEDDVIALLASGLKIADLLHHAESMLSNRMN